jgi:secondary thiamine-phosphate synthase enzyme
MLKRLTLSTKSRTQFLDITSKVAELILSSGISDGLCVVYVPHTTAGVTINECADPSVAGDILAELEKVIPLHNGYRHLEGNSAAHIKASLVGASCLVPVERGKMALGTWQGVFFCEFDGPRQRTVTIKIIGN